MSVRAPEQFIVVESLRHQRPESVREVAGRYGFVRKTSEGTRGSEIWVKEEAAGYFVIRIDSQGHGHWFHSRRPHYHKNWIEVTDLANYLEGFVPTAYVYSDEGHLLGKAGEMKGSDRLAKLQHIPR
jgi:hypothetical protein